MPSEHWYVGSTLTVNTASLFSNVFVIFVWIHFLSRVDALNCRTAKPENNTGVIFSVSK